MSIKRGIFRSCSKSFISKGYLGSRECSAQLGAKYCAGVGYGGINRPFAVGGISGVYGKTVGIYAAHEVVAFCFFNTDFKTGSFRHDFTCSRSDGYCIIAPIETEQSGTVRPSHVFNLPLKYRARVKKRLLHHDVTVNTVYTH